MGALPPRGGGIATSWCVALVTLIALASAPPSVVGATPRNNDERLIGWLGEVERPTGALRGASDSNAGGGGGPEGDTNDDSSNPPARRKQWIEQVATHPRAYVWHGFMSDEECDHIVRTAEPLMEKSGVIDAKTGEQTFDKIRTSFGAFLPIGYDAVVQRVEAGPPYLH
jgi:hypothetical protein